MRDRIKALAKLESAYRHVLGEIGADLDLSSKLALEILDSTAQILRYEIRLSKIKRGIA